MQHVLEISENEDRLGFLYIYRLLIVSNNLLIISNTIRMKFFCIVNVYIIVHLSLLLHFQEITPLRMMMKYKEP